MGGTGIKRSTGPRRRREEDGRSDPCNIEIEVDLVGLQPIVSEHLRPTHVLTVKLVRNPPVVSVVCVDARGRIAGSLSAFLGLAQLIACLERKIAYEATVLFASATRCTVHVRRTGAA